MYYSRNSQVGYPIADTRGNIVLITDATGALRNGFVYTGFKQWQAYGTNTYQDVHGFSSKWVDASKLIFFGQFWVSPRSRRRYEPSDFE